MENTDIKGHLLLMMAPSGSGKKSIIDEALADHDDIYFAKTYTTRERREGTEENPLYNFTDRETFESMRDNDELIEWAEFSGNYYGTPKSELIEPLKESRVVFKEMELQGVQQIRKLIPEENVTVVYVDAGSWEDLEKRIVARAPITEEELAMRKQRYEEESKYMGEADVIVKNHDGELESAVAHMKQVVDGIVESCK